LNTDGYAKGVFVSGDYAYVADGYNGLLIMDVSNPTNPEIVFDMLWMYIINVMGF